MTGLQIALVGLTMGAIAQFVIGMKRFVHVSASSGLTLVKIGSTLGWSLILVEELHASALSPWRWALGMALLIGSILLFRYAASTVRSRPLTFIFSEDVPGHVVVLGPYRFIRHPFYTSYCAVFVSAAVVLMTPETVAWACAMVALYTYAALAEERKFLLSDLAPEYQGLRRRTGMLLPNPLKWFKQRRDRWSGASNQLLP